jgi:predicted peroxiredoxin
LSKYIQVLLAKGIKIYACPTCMSVAGMKPEDLKDGIHTANKEAFFNFTKGRILALDY